MFRLVLLIVAAVVSVDSIAEARLWKSKSGAELEADYVQSRSGYVTLKSAEGKQFRIHLSKLSQADRDYVGKRMLQLGFSPAAGTRGRQKPVISARRSEKLAGIIAYGGWLGGSKYYDLDYCEDMAVAMVNGDKDRGANNWTERDKDVLENRDCEVRIFTHPGGHKIAPANVTDEVIAWLEEESKKM